MNWMVISLLLLVMIFAGCEKVEHQLSKLVLTLRKRLNQLKNIIYVRLNRIKALN